MSIVETNVPTISNNQQRLLFLIVSHTILVFAYKQKSVSSIKYQHFGIIGNLECPCTTLNFESLSAYYYF